MTDPNNLTPPPELVREWIRERDGLEHLAAQAARWGADQELEACCEWLDGYSEDGHRLRAARRPQPQPTHKELALKALDAITTNFHVHEPDAAAVRRALESLPDGPAVTPAAEPAAAPDRPLWEAMQAAHDKAATNRSGYAAELRVVADQIRRQWEAKHGTVHSVVDEVLDWLRAEAERAEAP